ncbi:MAG: hypothetical protein WD185_05320 [Sneathiella sp.]
MAAGNYDEGIERINLTGASSKPHQRELRERQAKRMRFKVIGTSVAILIAFSLYGSYWLQTLGRSGAAEKAVEAATLIETEQYKQALDVADDLANSGHYQWYGHLYKTVALIYLQRFKEAGIEADKMASFYQSRMKMPRRFLRTYILAKLLNHNVDEALQEPLSDRFSPAIMKIIREVRAMSNVCYPIVTIADIDDLHSIPEKQGCFPGPNE